MDEGFFNLISAFQQNLEADFAQTKHLAMCVFLDWLSKLPRLGASHGGGSAVGGHTGCVKTLSSDEFLFLRSIRSFSDTWALVTRGCFLKDNQMKHSIQSVTWLNNVGSFRVKFFGFYKHVSTCFRFGVLARCWNSSSCRCWWCMPPFPPRTRRSLEGPEGHLNFHNRVACDVDLRWAKIRSKNFRRSLSMAVWVRLRVLPRKREHHLRWPCESRPQWHRCLVQRLCFGSESDLFPVFLRPMIALDRPRLPRIAPVFCLDVLATCLSPEEAKAGTTIPWAGVWALECTLILCRGVLCNLRGYRSNLDQFNWHLTMQVSNGNFPRHSILCSHFS